LDRDQTESKSEYLTTSALMNHLSKSECIAQAACGAVESNGIVQALVSFSQVVK
jgi:hypothetical protein